MLNSNWKWFFSMCTSEFFAFEATWSPSRCHCDLSSAASTFGQGWVKCADGELQKSESQAALGISESQSLLALCCILFHIFSRATLESKIIGYIQCSMRFSCWSVYKPSLPKKDLERFESDDVQAMLSEDVREIRPMIQWCFMMFRCSRKAMGHGGSWTMGCQKGRPSLLPWAFEDLWSTSWYLRWAPKPCRFSDVCCETLPRDAPGCPASADGRRLRWEFDQLCATFTEAEATRTDGLQVKETKMTKITVVVLISFVWL